MLRTHRLSGSPDETAAAIGDVRTAGVSALVIEHAHRLATSDLEKLLAAARAAPGLVTVVVTGAVTGAALELAAVAGVCVAVSGSTFAWGPEPVRPGLAWSLSTAVGPWFARRLAFGGCVTVGDAVRAGLVHQQSDSVDAALVAVAATVDRFGADGSVALNRSLRAAGALPSYESAARYDRHLARSADGTERPA